MNIELKEIDREFAERAFHGTSFDPDKRGESVIRSYKGDCEELMKELGDYFTQETADKLHSLYTSYLHAHSRCMSPMITGPANFPVRRNEKANRSADNRWQELMDFISKIKKRAKKVAKREEIEEAGGELEVAKKKLDGLKKAQETMKAANKIIRSMKPKNESSPEKLEKLKQLGIKKPEDLFVKDYSGRVGFVGYQLTNNNARIKNTEIRVRQLENIEKRSVHEDKVFNGDGVTVTCCFADNRLRITHDDKPSAEVRDQLKSHGFKWSRFHGAWQRMINNNAIYQAEQITGLNLTKPQEPSPEEPVPAEEPEVHEEQPLFAFMETA